METMLQAILVTAGVIGLGAWLLWQQVHGDLLEKMPPLERDKDWNVRR